MRSRRARTERTALSLAVTTEIRAQLAARHMTQTQLADATNLSQTYLSKRLSDQAPFDLSDIDVICEAMDIGDPGRFIVDAFNRWAPLVDPSNQ